MNLERSWAKLLRDACSDLDSSHFSKITFVWSKRNQRRGGKEHVLSLEDEPSAPPDETPMSVCTRYLQWRFGPSVELDSHLIDLWEHGDELYLFPAEDFDLEQDLDLASSEQKEEPSEHFLLTSASISPVEFQSDDYQDGFCHNGTKQSTSLVVLAFYYLKVLSASQREGIWLCSDSIQMPESEADPLDGKSVV